MVLNEGGPVAVESTAERIGSGPWARWLATALVADEGSIAAESARSLARAGRVHAVSVEPGEISAQVTGTGGRELDVTLAARPVASRIWAAVSQAAQGRPLLEDAVAGREQSLHLQHEMAADWAEPLVPRGRTIRASCSCSQSGHHCQHIAAVAYVIADAIDADPSLLLRWRGCEPVGPSSAHAAEAAPAPEPPADSDALWRAGPLPAPAELRPLPAGAVLMRLGPSGVNVGGNDLADVLQRAYDRFGAAR